MREERLERGERLESHGVTQDDESRGLGRWLSVQADIVQWLMVYQRVRLTSGQRLALTSIG